jgi:S-adenosylmethionine:tRNA ribosyltransferase-isomerase
VSAADVVATIDRRARRSPLPARLPPARSYPERRDGVRLLALDPANGDMALGDLARLPALLRSGDLLVLNDAATLPASLHGRDAQGRPLEVRLAGAVDAGTDGHFAAVVFGAGDWRQRTEDRPPPPPLAMGDRLLLGTHGDGDDGPLGATVLAISPLSARLVELRFDARGDAFWAALYRQARPVQYAHLHHALPLWAVQNVYAARPWAFEMPSAGRPLSWAILLALRQHGVQLHALTHAAGLSATGDPVLDAALPLPERFDIPAATAAAVAQTHRQGGRVVAVGTTVVRALEGAHALWGELRAGTGVTDLRLHPGHRRRVVDGVLSGLHDPQESHFALLASFAELSLLRAAHTKALAAGMHSHELGDLLLVLPRTLQRDDSSGASDRRALPSSSSSGRALAGRA